eukprot:460323-Lingulodinium_polyedra.AAC.1
MGWPQPVCQPGRCGHIVFDGTADDSCNGRTRRDGAARQHDVLFDRDDTTSDQAWRLSAIAEQVLIEARASR